jgi:hypothetical protein
MDWSGDKTLKVAYELSTSLTGLCVSVSCSTGYRLFGAIPVLGDVSQNWVWSNWPPGELAQQVLDPVLLGQLNGGLVQVGGSPAKALGAATRESNAARKFG